MPVGIVFAQASETGPGGSRREPFMRQGMGEASWMHRGGRSGHYICFPLRHYRQAQVRSVGWSLWQARIHTLTGTEGVFESGVERRGAQQVQGILQGYFYRVIMPPWQLSFRAFPLDLPALCQGDFPFWRAGWLHFCMSVDWLTIWGLGQEDGVAVIHTHTVKIWIALLLAVLLQFSSRS